MNDYCRQLDQEEGHARQLRIALRACAEVAFGLALMAGMVLLAMF